VAVRLLQSRGRAHPEEHLGNRGGGCFGGEAELAVMKISSVAGLRWWRGRAHGDEDLGGRGGGGGLATVERQSSR
jgi:hypothetical protein